MEDQEVQQLFIPKKIKVGYDKRDDTYTKKLAYVIYYDDKGVLRKEKSWEGWRDKKIKPDDYDNVPTEGFVLNKGVGGQRESYGWNARNEYIRVYDPRGFEFEISVANLLYILQEATSTKGKGLEGEFIYSWEGKELVLLPVGSASYKNSQEYTKLQNQKVSTKDLVAGCVYKTKKQEDLIYLGRFNYYTLVNPEKRDWKNNKYDYYHNVIKESKMHVFLNEAQKDAQYGKYVIVPSPSNISVCINDIPVSNYAELVDKYNKEIIQSSKPVDVELKSKTIKLKTNSRYWWDVLTDSNYFVKLNDNEYLSMQITANTDWKDGKYVKDFTISDNGRIVSFKDGKLETRSSNNSNAKKRTLKEAELLALEVYDLMVTLESGKKINFKKYNV